MIATVDIADLGLLRTVKAIRRRPKPKQVPGLRWLDIVFAIPLAMSRPPRPRRAVMLALWDDEEAAAAFADSHPVAAPFKSGVHATLQPLRAFGSWPGLDDSVSRSRVTTVDGPVFVFTLGRLRISQFVRFMRASRPAERAAVAADGFVWGTASARPPLVATVSIWESAEASAAYAFTPPGGHPSAIDAQRRKDFHHESAFIRFTPIEIRGTIGSPNPLATEALAPSPVTRRSG
jgi:heme-degrading monooxygenase HmoA